MLDAAGITRAGEAVAKTREEAAAAAAKLGFPLVMKVIGPVHKSDVGGVVLGIKTEESVLSEFDRMIKSKTPHPFNAPMAARDRALRRGK